MTDERARLAVVVANDAPPEDGTRWLALLIRQGLLLIVAGIEVRYGLSRRGDTLRR